MSNLIIPAYYENWKRKIDNTEKTATLEFPLFTDACTIIDNISNNDCPYHVINLNTSYHDNIMLNRLLLRINTYDVKIKHNAYEIHDPLKEINYDFYLQNELPDQLAVLLSLCLGIRLKAGHASRLFENDDDRFGTPIAHFIHNNPPPIRLAKENVVLPGALKNIHAKDKIFTLSSIQEYFLSLINLTPKQAELLIRASKLYRDALWLIESEPQLSWIMLVSAIEVIAAEHIKLNITPIEIFEEDDPELANQIKTCGGIELLEKIANKFVDKKYVRRKYKKFLLEFLPPAPTKRPPYNMQVNWDDFRNTSNKNNPLMTIYDYRSAALHAGKPFPLDMCFGHPCLTGIPYELAEKPSATFAHYNGKTQKVKSGLMYLSVFEYIVRQTLLNWWKSCI